MNIFGKKLVILRFAGGKPDIAAVSYTHLDVYKRQAPDSVLPDFLFLQQALT